MPRLKNGQLRKDGVRIASVAVEAGRTPIESKRASSVRMAGTREAPSNFASGGLISGGFTSGGFTSGGFTSGGFTSGGLTSGGFTSGGFTSGGFTSGGLASLAASLGFSSGFFFVQPMAPRPRVRHKPPHNNIASSFFMFQPTSGRLDPLLAPITKIDVSLGLIHKCIEYSRNLGRQAFFPSRGAFLGIK
jgi:hypothetical protein